MNYKENVKVTLISNEDWKRARKYARRTVGKDDLEKEVSDSFKKELCISEHSPLREVRFEIEFTNIPVVISQQFSRHKIASITRNFYLDENINPTDVEHYVQSQRPCRTGVPRTEFTNYACTANIQGLIDMSKKRLCTAAQSEARGLWNEVASQIKEIEPCVANVLVKTCIYRGFCPEKRVCCGYVNTKQFKEELDEYRR